MGGFARELLRNAEYLDHFAEPRPLLGRRELLALDLAILSRNDTAAMHHAAAESLEPEALLLFELPLDLDRLAKLAPDLPDWALVKAIGRLPWNEKRAAFLRALLRSGAQPTEVRLAAASALTRLAARGKVEMSKVLTEDHPGPLKHLDLELELFFHLDDDCDHLVVPYLERVAGRLDEHRAPWDTWGDAPWRLELAIHCWTYQIEQARGAEGVETLLRRAREAQRSQ